MSESEGTDCPVGYYQDLMAERRRVLDVDLANIFSQPRSFVCEIGSGHGHFLAAYAQQHPEQLCVGVDIIGDRVDRANRKRDRGGLAQLHFLHAEASLFLQQLPSSAKIHRVFILFPDPWPKKRHHKHRILQSRFLTLLHSRCTAGAELYFRTDYRPYEDDARLQLERHPLWEVLPLPWPFEHKTVFQERADSFGSVTARVRVLAP